MSRVVTIMAAFCAVGAVAGGPSAVAATPAPSAACPVGEVCVWSGANFTGHMALLPSDGSWGGCVTAAELGLSAVRSAQRNSVPCHLQASLHADSVCGRPADPEIVANQTPTISPAALSLDLFMIPC